MDTNPTKQRQQFYRDYASGQWSMSELCDRYQISRPTGYKFDWRRRMVGEFRGLTVERRQNERCGAFRAVRSGFRSGLREQRPHSSLVRNWTLVTLLPGVPVLA